MCFELNSLCCQNVKIFKLLGLLIKGNSHQQRAENIRWWLRKLFGIEYAENNGKPCDCFYLCVLNFSLLADYVKSMRAFSKTHNSSVNWARSEDDVFILWVIILGTFISLYQIVCIVIEGEGTSLTEYHSNVKQKHNCGRHHLRSLVIKHMAKSDG